jgi:hypothetical protein
MQSLARNFRSVGARLLPALALSTLLGAAAQAQDAPALAINGTLELNYTANFNKPFNGSNTFIYNKKEGQFAINLAQIQVSKAASAQSRTGFVIRVVDGEVRRYNFNLGEASDADPTALPFILEAYGTLLVPAGGRDIKVDAGQFVTHVGYETIDIGTNNFVSRNFLFQFPSPFYNTGVRAAVPLGARTTATGFLLNRYNGTNDTGNRDLGYGFQVVQTLGGTSSLVFNGLFNRENLAYDGSGPDSTTTPPIDEGELLESAASRALNPPSNPLNKQLGVLDLVYSNQFNRQLRFVAEGLYRFGKDANDESYNVAGGAGYLIYTLGNGNVISFRGEYLQQSKPGSGVLPGSGTNKPNLSSLTLSYEPKFNFFPGSRTLVEVRYDNSNRAVFAGEDNFKKNQTTFTLGQVFSL